LLQFLAMASVPLFLFIIRERFRRNVRELLFSWLISLAVAFVALNSTIAGFDPANIYVAVPIAFLLFVPAWLGYKVVRFAIGH